MPFVFPHFIMAAILRVKFDVGSGRENIKFYFDYILHIYVICFLIYLLYIYMFLICLFKLSKYLYFHISMITLFFSLYVQNCFNVNCYYKKNVCILMIRNFYIISWHNVRKRKFWTPGRLLFFFFFFFSSSCLHTFQKSFRESCNFLIN